MSYKKTDWQTDGYTKIYTLSPYGSINKEQWFCNKLFQNSIIHDKGVDWTRISKVKNKQQTKKSVKLDCRVLDLVCDTPHQGDHLCNGFFNPSVHEKVLHRPENQNVKHKGPITL